MEISFVVLAVLCLLSVPIAFTIGLAALAGLIVVEIPLEIVAQRMFTQIDSFTMLAIPFFILAGNLMDKGGISRTIVDLASQLVGHIRGGLAMVTIVACLLFGCISGSGAAASAAIGMILIPAMAERGYNKAFAGAITATSGPLGIIIPPSIVMVVYATAANVSVGSMFLAGYIPGTIIAVSLGIVCYVYATRHNYPAETRPSLRSLLHSLKKASFALVMVVLIMGGILGGFFTATEASVVAVVYSFFVGLFVYKGLKLRDVPGVIKRSSFTTAAVMFCVATTNVLAWALTSEAIIAQMSASILGITSNKYLMLLFFNLILLFIGMILDATPAIILMVPIIMPVAMKLGIDPVHLGIVTTVNLAIGMSSPPVGITLFVSSSISRVPISGLIRPLLPMWLAMVAFLFLITYVPELSLFLPGLFR